MAVRSLTTKEFTVFKDFHLTFSDGINILIGPNGTGKTHILKMIYASQFARKNVKELSKILNCFGVESGFHNVAAKIHTGEKIDNLSQSVISITLSESFDKQEYVPRNWNIGIDEEGEYRPIFISDKEIFNHAKLDKQDIKGYFATDEMLLDAVGLITAPKLDETSLSIEMLTILRKIARLLDGQVIYKKNRFFIEKTDGKTINFDMEAASVKKIALLYRLIEVGAIKPGSILLWDGIDNHLDKARIGSVCDILNSLAAVGVQVVITTVHNEILGHFEGATVKQPVFTKLYKENNIVRCNQYKRG